MQNKFVSYSIVVLSLFSVATSSFLLVTIKNLTDSNEEMQRLVQDIGKRYPQIEKSKDIFLAGYTKGIEEAEKDVVKAFEDGYHKATEDIQCPATGSVIQIQQPSDKKITPPKK